MQLGYFLLVDGFLVVHQVHQVQDVLTEYLTSAGVHTTQLELLDGRAVLEKSRYLVIVKANLLRKRYYKDNHYSGDFG